MPEWIGVFGRLHPLLVHLPIGLLVALFLLEIAADAVGSALPRRVVAVLAWMAAASAVLAAAAGYTLSREDAYGGRTLDLHLRYGLAIAACSVLTAIVHFWARDGTRSAGMRVYRFLLLVCVALLLPAGHLGSTIAHGEGFVTEPLRKDVHRDVAQRVTRESPPVVEAAEKGALPESADARGALGEGGARERSGSASGTSPEDGSKPAPKIAAAVSYTRDVAPVLATRCGACHGESKRKGGLSLKDPDAIREGGWDGVVIVEGRPEHSELVRRMKLPLDDEDHMPPPEKAQPTVVEVAMLEKWIAAGAPFDAAPSGAPTSKSPATDGASSGSKLDPERSSDGSGAAGGKGAAGAKGGTAPGGSAAIPPAGHDVISILREKLVHVETIARGSTQLYVDFAAVAATSGDAEVASWLEPVLVQTVDLSLARSKIGDDALKTAARMPNLRRLDLKETAVTDAGIAYLAGHPRLAELVLPKTHLTDASVESLLSLPSLARVFLWNSGVTIRGIAGLRASRPDLVIEAGYPSDAMVLESEREIALAKSGTPVSRSATPQSPAPAPSALCPLTGKPASSAYQATYGGKVISFCCAKCLAQFNADPKQFESKLR